MRLFLWLTFLTGIVYPLLITLIAQLTMNTQANGSMTKTGSALIAQSFQKEGYFWPRPSSIDYNPLPSGGSNLGPTSAALKKAVENRERKFGKGAPAELLFTSGSGLDPHISPETAYFQMERVAKARGLETQKLKELIDKKTARSIFGPPVINVLLLNQALDARQ